jgi:flagellar export protein FliJ
MAFRFSLESIYRLRKSLEHQQEQRLSQASYEVARAQVLMSRLDENYSENQRQWRAAFDDSNLVAALKFGAACEKGYTAARERAQAALAAAQEKQLIQLQQYWEARQKREILESLRERRYAEYRTDFARQQQQLADEMYLLRGFFSALDTNLPSQ